jgi:predicted DNA-binding transcriptional regulator YafY
MGRVAGIQTYENLLRILFILRDAPKIALPDVGSLVRAMTIKQVHKALESQGERLAEKTVNKYLKQLEMQRPPLVNLVYTGEKNTHYWGIAHNSPLNDSSVTDLEAAMICLSSDLLEPLLPPTLKQYLTSSRERAQEIIYNARPIGVLPSNSPLKNLKLINRVGVETPPMLDGERQEIIFKALQSKKRLRISYFSNQRRFRGKQPISGEVSPVQLVQHGDARLYLIVTGVSWIEGVDSQETDTNDYLRLAVHRICKAELLDEEAIFSDELIKKIEKETGFGWKGNIRLKALIGTNLAMRLHECPINSTQNLVIKESEEWHSLEVTIDNNWELKWWVLSHGKMIIINEPPEFRDEIADHFREGFNHYFESNKQSTITIIKK